jgi:hypothetical protein
MGSHRVRLIDLLRAAESGQSLLVGPVTVQLDRSLLSWFHGLGTDRIVQGDQGDRIRLLAGGTGIDLTGAQVVIHYDRWWNPAKEEQATARVHRMGQHHPVQVYKLVTAGTLEEKIHRIIEEKRRLAADLVVEDDDSILKTLDRGRLADLFRLAR